MINKFECKGTAFHFKLKLKTAIIFIDFSHLQILVGLKYFYLKPYLCPMPAQKVSFKEINRLAIPAIFAGIIEPLISLTDTAVAGRLPMHTAEALGAIGLVGSFLSALTWIFVQTSSALSALVSHAVGQNRLKHLISLNSQVFWINLGITLLLSAGSFLLAPWILKLYGAKDLLLEMAIPYLKIRVWGFPFTLLTLTIFGIFRGLQNTTWAMRISLVGGLTNIGLDLFFVYELNAGVRGIAFASVIAQGLMFILAFIQLWRKTPFKTLQVRKRHPLLFRTLRMSVDLFLRTFSLNVALFLAFRMASLLGHGENNQYVAAHTLLIQVWLFSSYFLDGYANAGRAIAGKLFGARDLKKLNLLIFDVLKIMLFIGILLGIAYRVLQRPIAEMLTHDELVQHTFYTAFFLVAFMQPINSVAFMMDGIYKGLGETRVLRNVFILAVLVGFIPPLILFYYLDFSLVGIWLAFLIWMIFRAGGLSIHYYKHYWKQA
nr:MATE family efflux transporter [Ornithobacterium rhinotracheale]